MGFDYNLHKSGVIPIYSHSLVHTQSEDKRGEYYQSYGNSRFCYNTRELNSFQGVHISWIKGSVHCGGQAPGTGLRCCDRPSGRVEDRVSDHLPFRAICLTELWIVGVCRFSGDTQPTQALAEVGKGAKLLIHEATMADDQAEMARIKAHSTVGQAIEIGRE